MSQKNIIIAVALIVLVVVVVFITKKNKENPGYSVVYLSSGEIYVGKLTNSSDLRIYEAYVLQVVQDAKDSSKNTFQLNPVKDALWAPEYLNLNEDNVVFYGPLRPDSEIAKTLASQIK